MLGVLQFYQKPLADLVHAQMQAHYETPAATYGPNRTLSGLVAKYARV